MNFKVRYAIYYFFQVLASLSRRVCFFEGAWSTTLFQTKWYIRVKSMTTSRLTWFYTNHLRFISSPINLLVLFSKNRYEVLWTPMKMLNLMKLLFVPTSTFVETIFISHQCCLLKCGMLWMMNKNSRVIMLLLILLLIKFMDELPLCHGFEHHKFQVNSHFDWAFRLPVTPLICTC